MQTNTTASDPPLLVSTIELPHGTLAEDTPFELHIRDRAIINSMVNFLNEVCDPHIREHTIFLLGFPLCIMVEAPTAVAHRPENEHGGPPIIVWLLDMAANERRNSEGFLP